MPGTVGAVQPVELVTQDRPGAGCLHLRPWNDGDVETVLRAGSDPAVQRWMLTDAHRAQQSRPVLVAAALAQLTPEHREVLVQTHWLGRSVAETAAELGIPPGTVKSRTYYAVRALDGTGTRTEAASWGPTPNGRADVPGASALAPDRLAGLVVATSSGTELLVLRG